MIRNSRPDATPLSAPRQMQGKYSTQSKLILILAIIAVSMNLRPALISLGPVLESVRASLDLSGTAIGVLITLPVLCFGVFAPFTTGLLRFQSPERLIFLGLLALTGGLGLRSLLGAAGLFAGTLVAGASISVIMVLLPSIIKHHFPRQAGLMMGLYSTAMCLGAAFAAAGTVPLEHFPGSNWQWALAFWSIPALVAAVIWFPQMPPADPLRHTRSRRAVPRLRSNRLAWQVTLFMGSQSSIAYCIFGWLPVILIDRGLSPLISGFVLSATMAAQLVTSLAGPWLATRGKDQRSTIAVMLVLVLIGLMGLMYGPLGQAVWVWASIFGLGSGGMFSIALALLVLRSPNPQVAAAISGMAQGIGYTLAAAGPLLVGLLHQYTGNWNAVAAFFVLLIVATLYFGLLAGRALYIKVDPET